MYVYTTCTLNPFYRIQFHIVLIHFRHLHHNIVSINGRVAYAGAVATAVLVVVVVVVFGVDIIKIRRNANQFSLFVLRVFGYNADGFLMIISLPVLRVVAAVFQAVCFCCYCSSAALENSFNHPFDRPTVHASIHLHFPCALDRCTQNSR